MPVAVTWGTGQTTSVIITPENDIISTTWQPDGNILLKAILADIDGFAIIDIDNYNIEVDGGFDPDNDTVNITWTPGDQH